jgi:hypothetical protein
VDAVLVVARSGRTTPADIRATIRHLGRAGGTDLFTVLNFARGT